MLSDADELFVFDPVCLQQQWIFHYCFNEPSKSFEKPTGTSDSDLVNARNSIFQQT